MRHDNEASGGGLRCLVRGGPGAWAGLLVALALGGCGGPGPEEQVPAPTPVQPEPGSWSSLPAPVLTTGLLSYEHPLPAHFQQATVQGFDNTPADNPITQAGATLGRVLFHDKRLSANGTTACASCHRAEEGFSDARALSVGFAGELTRRNSMSLINLRYYDRGAMFWDERASTLEAQVLEPIQDVKEMGLTLEQLVARVQATDYYAPLFTQAFGDSTVTQQRIARALAQFLRAIVSYQSRWDEGVARTGDISRDFPNFTAQENRGKVIFFGQHDANTRGLCGTCHLMNNPLAFRPGPPGAPGPAMDNVAVFYMLRPANNGLLDATDNGRGEVTGNARDNGTFKSPSLRNIALTGPYMHDGRFQTLEEVVRFYDSGIQAHPNLDPALRDRNGNPLRLNLSREDQAALVAFLRTLTDETLAQDARYANPFPR